MSFLNVNNNPRSPSFNILKKNFDKKDLLIMKRIFSKMCMIRKFELNVYNLRKKNTINTLVYLSLGQESIYASVSEAIPSAYVFGQHRGHGTYLSYGGNAIKLADEISGLVTGSNKGMGGSPSITDRKKNIFGHVGLIGDQVPVAAGYALEKKDKIVVCFLGDGAAEEDYVLATLGFVKKFKLKIIFVCDDNDLSVLTPTKDRRTWRLADIAKSFGLASVDITDDPLTIFYNLKKILKNTPALINIRTCREYWHEGAGRDKPGKYFWSRYNIFKAQLEKLNLSSFVKKEEEKWLRWSEKIWKKQLQKL